MVHIKKIFKEKKLNENRSDRAGISVRKMRSNRASGGSDLVFKC